MRWFQRKAPRGVTLPFPPDRLAALCTFIIPGSIVGALRLRQASDLTVEIVRRSLFFNSYVCAYPGHLDQIDHPLGAAVRFAMLHALIAHSESEAQWRFDTFQSLMERGDTATHEAFALGAADGASYFTALLAPADADDTATVNLRLAVRAYKAFPPLDLPSHLQGE